MPDDFEKHFLTVIEREFPEHAELRVQRESGDICIYADWKLGNDPARPNKRSKTIKICLSREAFNDYVSGGKQSRKSADERLRRAVAAQLKVFDPDHKVPAHVPAPIEQWTITTRILNG